MVSRLFFGQKDEALLFSKLSLDLIDVSSFFNNNGIACRDLKP